MPSIIYGGVKYTQCRHALYCKKCKDTIESKSDHDFQYCSCGAIGIDGGISYGNRILGNIEDMENRSMYRYNNMWLPEEVILNNLKNKLYKQVPH
jgi:hypothetical protein